MEIHKEPLPHGGLHHDKDCHHGHDHGPMQKPGPLHPEEDYRHHHYDNERRRDHRVEMKRYHSTSQISVTVVLPNGVSKRVSFQSLTGGGSCYYTDSADLQWALEHHYRFGSQFHVDPFFRPHRHHFSGPHGSRNPHIEVKAGVSAVPPIVPGDAHKLNGCEDPGPDYIPEHTHVSEVPLKRVKMPDFATAKDYLCDKFNLSRTKLRSQVSIINAAAEHGISFDFE